MQFIKRIIEYNKKIFFSPEHSKRGSFIASVGSFLGAIGGTLGAVGGGLAAAGTAGALGTAYTGSAIALGTMAVGTVASGAMAAYGSYQQGQAQKNMMNYQAKAAAVQQQIVKQNAQQNITSVQDQAAMNSGNLSRQQLAQKGAIAASIGGQGLGGSVTAVNLQESNLTKMQRDQMTLQYNANVKTWDITNQTNNQLWGLGAQVGQYEAGAANAQTAGDIAAAGSLLNTASQVGTEAYYQRKF